MVVCRTPPATPACFASVVTVCPAPAMLAAVAGRAVASTPWCGLEGQLRGAAAALQGDDPRVLVDRVGDGRGLRSLQALVVLQHAVGGGHRRLKRPIAAVRPATLVPRQPTSPASWAQRYAFCSLVELLYQLFHQAMSEFSWLIWACSDAICEFRSFTGPWAAVTFTWASAIRLAAASR